jgi:hypothetical protein
MKAIEFEQHNVVFAKDQKEYLPFPAHAQNNGLVTFCMELDDQEFEAVKKTKILKLTVLTFGRSAQPIRVTTVDPAFPVTHKGQFHCNPKSWGEGPESPATFEIELSPINIQALKKSRKIWITTATFGTPLQPINMILNS